MISRRFQKLCIREIRNEMAPDEQVRFYEGLNARPAYRAHYEAIRQTWARTRPEDFGEIDMAARWQAFKSRLQAESETIRARTVPARVSRVPVKRRIWAPAIGFAVILVFIVVRQGLEKVPVPVFASTQHGEHTTRILADGSVVHLNHLSTLETVDSFSDTLRWVRLQGEAWFEIQPGKVPFEVRTDQTDIRVLGTRFNVWCRDRKTRVMVSEGSVRFTGSDGSESVVLQRGEMSWNAAGGLPDPVRTFTEDSVRYRPGWMDGFLEFYRFPLYDIASELERTFQRPVDVADSSLGLRSVTARYQDESLETILESLALTLNMDVNREGDGYRLSIHRISQE